MFHYLANRLGQGLLVLVGVTTATFFALRIIPGDPARVIAPNAKQADLIKLREELNLDSPILSQYGIFLRDIVHGDLGQSYFASRSVIAMILEKLPNTMYLVVLALVLALALALPLGFIAGAKRGSVADRASLLASVTFQSMPNFWVGLILIQVIALNLALLPATGYDGFSSLILPAIALALPLVAVLARVIRTTLADALEKNYVLALKSRGIPYRRVVIRHGARAVAVPLLTVLGVQMGYLLGGTVVIEYLFNYPGVGELTLSAVSRRDYPLIQGIVLVLAAIFVTVNLVVDILYLYLDPRIRRQETATR